MQHFQFSGEHYRIGVERGRRFQQAGITFPLQLDAFQLAHGHKSLLLLQDCFPEVCKEMQGFCDTMHIDYSSFAAWMLCMGCCMYNLKQNLPVEVRGCTAFAFTKDGHVLYGRNNDLPPYLRKDCKSELYMPAGGNSFWLTTSSFINGEEGLNAHGLAVAMTFVMTRLEKIRPGLNACFLVRYLLEKADSTAQALSMLMDLPVASNYNILLADRQGHMAVVECTPQRKHVR